MTVVASECRDVETDDATTFISYHFHPGSFHRASPLSCVVIQQAVLKALKSIAELDEQNIVQLLRRRRTDVAVTIRSSGEENWEEVKVEVYIIGVWGERALQSCPKREIGVAEIFEY